jgi:FkbM family methyltransferase
LSLFQSADTARINDVELSIEPGVMSPEMIKVIRSGSYEGTEAREIARIVQPGERVVELGAGIGFIAITALKTGRVNGLASYEANPHLIPVIEKNAALNGVSFDVHNAIVEPAPRGATLPFYLRKDFWASSMSPQPWGYVEEVAVPVVSFDSVRERYRPTMLIVDIEGAEEHLFRDVALTGIKKIYVELHQNVIGRVGMKNVFDFMSSRDFHYDQHHSRGSVVLFSHVLR